MVGQLAGDALTDGGSNTGLGKGALGTTAAG